MSREYEPGETSIYCVHEEDFSDESAPVGPAIAAFRDREDAEALANALKRPYMEYQDAIEEYNRKSREFASAAAKLDIPAITIGRHNQRDVYEWIKWSRPDADIPEPPRAPQHVEWSPHCVVEVTLRGEIVPRGFDPEPLEFAYRNHRGEVARRRVLPLGVRFGSTAWHPEPQWLMEAYDLDKQERRTFAMRDVLGAAA